MQRSEVTTTFSFVGKFSKEKFSIPREMQSRETGKQPLHKLDCAFHAMHNNDIGNI